MKPSPDSAIVIILAVAAVTVLTRALPFIVFKKSNIPGIVSYLGRVLPVAIIAMLIVYCMKGITFASWPFGLPEIAAVCAVALLHLWKRNTLLSIAAGTFLYMLLIRI